MRKPIIRRSLEEKKNLRKALFFGVLTIAGLLGFLYYGFPTVARFSAFLADLRKSSQPVDINDTTPPAPPKFENLPEFTSENNIDIVGSVERGATVVLFLNNKTEEVLANNDGEFRHSFSLLKGENSVRAKAIDAAGNESQETNSIIITHDNTPPELSILSPEDGKQFYGAKERQVSIEGETEEGISVTVNDRIVAVDNEGKFTFTTSLSEGENTFTIKAKDKAENETESSLTLHFSP